VLLHEAGAITTAAGAGPQPPGSPHSAAAQRAALLRQALQHAERASELAPNSIAVAALRAAVAINLLIEESAALGAPSVLALPAAAAAAMAGPLPNGRPSPVLRRAASGANPPSAMALIPLTAPVTTAKGDTAAGDLATSTSEPSTAPPAPLVAASEARCEQLRRSFAGALSASAAAITHSAPLASEPLITLGQEPGYISHDPCAPSSGEATAVVFLEEARSQLAGLQGVLHSCQALLESHQVPAEGVVRLLQHLLR